MFWNGSQMTINAQESNVYCELTPAVPTDTCAVLNRLLQIAEQGRKELSASNVNTLIPRGVATMLLRTMKVRDPSIILHGQRIAAISRGVSELLG